MRTYAPSAIALAPIIKLGWQPRVEAPKIPFYQFGHLGAGAQIISSAAPIATIATTAALHSLTAIGTAAGPIGAAVGAVIGIIAGLWAKHDARVKGAKTENAAVASAVQVVDGALQAIFSGANSGGITAQDAIQQCTQLLQDYWSRVANYHRGPGQADASNGGANCTNIKCDKSCTASCCVGCADIQPSILNCIQVFQAGGGTARVYKVFGDKYGLQTRAGYSLTYTAPAAGQSISAALTGGSGSMLPLLLLAGAAFLVMG
jgi:hypothetical protein